MDVPASPIAPSRPRLHAATAPAMRTPALGVIGAGRVGGALLDPLRVPRAHLAAHGGARMRFEAVPAHHSFAHTRPADAIVQLRSARYCDNPLIVRGSGAGPQLTAAGVVADLPRIAETHGARA